MKQAFIVFIGILLSFSLMSQNTPHRCGTVEYLAYQKKRDTSLQARMDSLEKQTQKYLQNEYQPNQKTVVTIPVVVHVLWNISSQNISDAQINSQIAVLNEDYRRLNADTVNTPTLFKGVAADCELEFCLAKQDPQGNYTTGITRTQTNKTVFDLSADDAKYNSTGGHDIWDRDSYLNIWVVPSIKDGSTTDILGYAQFPGDAAPTDGVVIQYTNFGRIGNLSPYYNKGRTTTHEVGHWLNLYHIWGDDGTGCWGTDYVNDTPNQADENYNCPTFPEQSCSNTSDMYSNYMDYTDDDCMNIFTAGQKARIWATMNGFRKPLKSSIGCVSVGLGEKWKYSNIDLYPNPSRGDFQINFNENFSGIITISNGLGEVVFEQDIFNRLAVKLSLPNAVCGIYFVSILSENKYIVKKIQIIK